MRKKWNHFLSFSGVARVAMDVREIFPNGFSWLAKSSRSRYGSDCILVNLSHNILIYMVYF